MKRFLAFFGGTYYPSGGMADFIGSFDTKSQAIQACKGKCRKENSSSMYANDKERWEDAWAHVWDSDAEKLVWKKRGS